MPKNKKIKFLVTVDVETYSCNGKLLPFDVNVWGRIGGKEYGVQKIMEILDGYNLKGVFFVDVYEHYQLGKNNLRELCRNINKNGHDVQLHAHVSFIPGHTDDFIKSYDRAEQTRIIAEGKEFIGECIGKKPVAFRGGAYGVNLDTMAALEENGFLIDSSFFAGHRNCDLNTELRTKYNNRPFFINGILEIPVTVYDLVSFPFMRKMSKLDVNPCSLFELRDVVRRIINDSNLDFVVLFLHSFSFIRWDKTYSSATIDFKTLNNFESVLNFLVKNYCDSVEFITFDSIGNDDMGCFKSEDLEDYIPKTKILSLFNRFLKKI